MKVLGEKKRIEDVRKMPVKVKSIHCTVLATDEGCLRHALKNVQPKGQNVNSSRYQEIRTCLINEMFLTCCSVQSLYNVDELKELFSKARFARCRARFSIPVILFEGKVLSCSFLLIAV